MKKFYLFLTATIAALACTLSAGAQSFAVQSTTQLIPPYSVYLSDYAAPGNEKLQVILVQRDLTQASYQVRLMMEVELNGRVIMRTSRTFNPRPISLDPGIPMVIAGADLAPYLDIQNIDFVGYSREQYARTKALPEGSYRICFNAYDYRRQDVKVSNDGCTFYYLSKNEPPLANLPLCGTKVEFRQAQQVIFSWLPRNTASPTSAAETEYELSLYETRPEGRNPNDVVLSSEPVFKTVTDFTQYVYGPADHMLFEGMTYVWRLRAIDKNGRDAFRNNGFSEVCTFRYGGFDPRFDIGVVKNLQAQGETERRGKIWWETGEYESYRVEYRKTGKDYNGEEYQWFQNDTREGEVKIYDLEPDTEYETRVLARKNNAYGPGTEIIKFRTPPVRVAQCGETTPVLSLADARPLTSAYMGMVVNARGMEMTLLDVTPLDQDGYYKGIGKVAPRYLGGASFHVQFERIFISEDRNVVGPHRIDFITQGVAAMMQEQLAEQKERQADQAEQENREAWAGTEFHEEIFLYDNIEIDTVTIDASGNVVVMGSNGVPYVNTEVPAILADAPEKAIILEDKNGDQWVVQKDQATGETKVTKVEGGGLVVGTDGQVLTSKQLRKLDRMILASLRKYKKAIEDYQASIKQTPGKGGGPSLFEWELEMFYADLPQCLAEHKDKLNDISTRINIYLDSVSAESVAFRSRIAEAIAKEFVTPEAQDNAPQERIETEVCVALIASANVSSYVSRFMIQLQQLFNDNNRITVDNQLVASCPNLSANLKPEQDKITHIPATLDTRIYITDNSEFNFTTLQSELSRLPENNNVRVFIVIVRDDKVIGLLNKRLTDLHLLSLDKYYSVQRAVAPGSSKCAVAEQLVKDFLKDYSTALATYYSNLNKQFPNKICNNVNPTLSPNASILKEDGLEDYAGLSSAARDEIKTYLNEFSQAYGHSIKTYFTSHASAALATAEGASVFENLKSKFDKGEFDNASYGIWLHYDDNSGCVYIRHGLNENKVFQGSRKSKLTKSSDKQQIIAEAKRAIDNVIAELNGKGTQGWTVLASNFKSFWKATVGGVATVYDMGRETYETGQTPVRLWDDTKANQYNASPFHDPTDGIGSGGGDAIVAKVMEIPQLVSFGYDIATKEQVRTQLVNTVKEVSWPKLQNAATDFFVDKKNKYAGGGNVMRHEASLDVSSALLELIGGAKILEMLQDILKKLGKEAREAVIQAIKEKISDPEQITRFIKDIDGNDELLDAIAKKTDLIDSWKKLDDAGLASLTKNADAVKYVDDLRTPKLGSAARLDYRKTFKEEAFPEIADDIYQVHHGVPQKVFNKYPGRITEAELNSLENLRGISKANSKIHQQITNRWEVFYQTTPNFTRQDALDFAKKIDDEFGHQFLPPIR